jgi:hypothetical protein
MEGKASTSNRLTSDETERVVHYLLVAEQGGDVVMGDRPSTLAL